MKHWVFLTGLALSLAGCTGTPAGPGAAGQPGAGGTGLTLTAATDANVALNPSGPVAIMPNGGIGMSFVTKQGWVIMVLSPQIAAGSVLQMGASAPGTTETGKAMATYANEGKTWVSQSGTLTFEKLGSLTAGGTVARFTDVVFKANPGSGGGATGSFTLNGTVTGAAATAI